MKRHHRLPRRIAVLVLTTIAIGAAVAAGHGGALAADTWRGLTVAPEHRCTHYDRAAYPYSQSVEAEIVASMGGAIYEPYTGRLLPNPAPHRRRSHRRFLRSPRQRTYAQPARFSGAVSPPTCST